MLCATIADLSTFIAIAQLGSFNAVARAFGVTRYTLSYAMCALEALHQRCVRSWPRITQFRFKTRLDCVVFLVSATSSTRAREPPKKHPVLATNQLGRGFIMGIWKCRRPPSGREHGRVDFVW
ncbi:helix-turn-helix domain-containing protein [Paraburkholderia sp. GAS199]|uniref:helix-turn-helix domain-containing protein n=1 Tax=Paraburkholderia sp. GAS199 TaxID=3035126 RepID=UPI003D1D0606